MKSIDQKRSIKTILNAVSAILFTIVNGVFGLIVIRLIIKTYGSDFNGLNSTSNQIINILFIIEGGFTIASTVVLFEPLTKNNFNELNNILSTTKKKFEIIGLKFLVIGFIISLLYTFIINSNLPKDLIFTVVFMTVIPVAFNLYYATTYRVILQALQKEYIINFFNLITIGLGHITNIIMISFGGSVWLVRCIIMTYAILNSLLVKLYVQKSYKFIDIKKNTIERVIPGVKDVMVQKITGMLYNSLPILFLSVLPTSGTLLASVYAVYSNIFTMIKSILHGVIDAPRLSLGHMIVSEKYEKIWTIFSYYQYISFIAIYIFVTTSFALTLPFISIFTVDINDINYYDRKISIFMAAITAIEMIHIPSGQLLNMAGYFKIMKNFQLISCLVLIITMTIGCHLWGIYGILTSVLVVALLLSILELSYVHFFFFKNKIIVLLKMLSPLILSGFLLCLFEISLVQSVDSLISFVIIGFFLLICNSIVAITLSFLFNKEISLCIVKYILSILRITYRRN